MPLEIAKTRFEHSGTLEFAKLFRAGEMVGDGESQRNSKRERNFETFQLGALVGLIGALSGPLNM